MMIQRDQVLKLLEEHPLLLDRYEYGTAGFRYDANLIGPVMVRVGLVARLLFHESSSSNKNIGVMLTASHNDESYNGVKIAAEDGSMLDATREALMVKWVNETDVTQWKDLLTKLAAEASSSPQGKLVVGRDTRSHSPKFATLVIQAAEAMGVEVENHDILTTPMLHHIVLVSNTTTTAANDDSSSRATRAGYIQQLAEAYMALDKLLLSNTGSSDNNKTSPPPLQVDGACGVGYAAVQELQSYFETLDSNCKHRLVARNPPGSGPLNEKCGSEHVQKQLFPPKWYDEDATTSSSTTIADYACSVDGDADRIVFWSSATDGTWTLLDGDKIAVLMGQFFQQLQASQQLPAALTIGVVQTAYANGASTQYIQDTLKLPVVITKTGVKHLHHAALQFDIGIYFEANGHGTVLFSENYTKAAATTPILQYLAQLINPAVGDAMSDLLFVDLLLRKQHWTLHDWATRLYTDLPSRQLKVKVQDRSKIICNGNETQALQPAGLQAQLDQANAAVSQGRSFVRPSGTENVVRIYAEASTRADADALALRAAKIVHETCQGVGDLPTL